VFGGGPSRYVQFHGLCDLSARKRWTCRTPAQENLVHIVVQDDTKPLQVMTAKRSADLFREGIANRIGMTDSLALDHFHILRMRPGSFSGADTQFQFSLPGNYLPPDCQTRSLGRLTR
jgi:hypothetical protein